MAPPYDNILNVDPFGTINNQTIILPPTQIVQVIKPNYGDRAWTFSHNFTDKTTWFADSIRVVNEAVGTGDGVETVFTLDHAYVIDVNHGKVTDEDYCVPTAAQGGTTYIAEVKINGVTKTEREFDVVSGGDYEINHVTGEITFFTPPGNGLAITATYFYSPANAGSTVYVKPAGSKKMIITSIECQMSADIDMTTAMISAVFTYNPYLGAPPAKFEYPTTRASYKRMTDFIGYTNGAFPPMPALGGTGRGTQNIIYQLRYEYIVAITLDPAYGSELRIWLGNDIPYGGELAQITFYGYYE